jgi:hypothetical protein
VLLLVPFHTGRIFDIWEPFYAKSAEVSASLTYIFVGAVNPWHMPLFFLLAGAATWFALSFRSGGEYVKERFRRLVIPLAFGLLVIVPPQPYLGALTYGNFDGSFLQYYPQFFQIGPGGGLEGYMGGFTPGHLWFILMLFLLSLIALPLLVHLRREAGRRLAGKLAAFFARPGAIFLLAVPLGPMLALPDLGGKNPFYYLTLFVYGYVLMADARFAEILDRHKTSALVLGLGILLPLLVILAFGVDIPAWLDPVLGICFQCLVTWFLLVYQQGARICQWGSLPILHPPSDGDRRHRFLRGPVERQCTAQVPGHQRRRDGDGATCLRAVGQADQRNAHPVRDKAPGENADGPAFRETKRLEKT